MIGCKLRLQPHLPGASELILHLHSSLFTAPPSYTQLGSRTPSQPGAYSQSAWPQWQASAEGQPTSHQSAAAATAGTGTGHSSTAASGGQGGPGQQEELSDMLRMLDNTGTEFSDLSGMFPQFTE